MKKKLHQWLGFVLFAFALFVLHRELGEFHYTDLVHQMRLLKKSQLLAALALTFLNYFTLTFYDFTAFKHIKHPLRYPKIALAAFIGNAFSNNVSLSGLAGGSVRYRLYSAWGLSALEITQIIFFYSMTFVLGFLALGAAVFLFSPFIPPPFHGTHLPSVQPLGFLFAALVLIYAALVFIKKDKVFRLLSWEVRLPTAPVFLMQLFTAILEWILSASILYVLLPSALSMHFLAFTGIFLFAQMIGFLSQIPGGLGVLETTILAFLARQLPAPQVIASLVAYRVIYYLIPFFTGILLLGIHEVLEKKEKLRWGLRVFGEWVPGLIPHAYALAAFIAGVILLFSGVTPGVHSRMISLRHTLPLPVLELSHFLGSLAGVWLLFLARGLQRRLDTAYAFTSALLGAGVFFSLLKGLDYEEALTLLAMLLAFLPCRSHFYRKGSLFNEPFTLSWIGAITLALLCSVWLGFFAYKHVDYSHELWWQFSFSGNASRFLRASVGGVVLLLFFAVKTLFRSAVAAPSLPSLLQLEKIQTVIRESPRTYAQVALLGDKEILMSKSGKSFIMFGIQNHSWIAYGDPVGPQQEWAELMWTFREMADRYDGNAVFYQISVENVPLYLDQGFALLKIGEEARVELPDFTMQGGDYKEFRHLMKHLERDNCIFEIIPRVNVPAHLPEFKEISDAWLASKNAHEKGFSMGSFNEFYLQQFPAAVVRRNGKIIAFTNIWPGGGKYELSNDLMRYLPDSPRSVMDFLFLNLILWGKQEGYRFFNLGMAPLAGLEGRPLAPLWMRAGAFLFSYGEQFYNFQGLRQFKSKFYPKWEPKYIASPSGLAIPGILADLTALISGSLKGALNK